MQMRSWKTIAGCCALTASLGLFLPAVTVARADSKTPLSPEAKAGKALFQTNCATCHDADQTTKKIGPGLKNLLKNKTLPASGKPATAANVRQIIEKGAPDATPVPMPAFGEKLSKTDIDELMAYLKTL